MTAAALLWAATAVAGLVLGLWAALLAVQVLACQLGRRPSWDCPETPVSLVVLVPAHNEASVIGATVTHLLGQLGAHDRLLVVADNCSDETAALARQAGAWVVERHDAHRKGKGHALAHGMAQMQDQAPDVVVVIDADCRVSPPGGLAQLARHALHSGRPAQALDLMNAPVGAGLKVRMAAFAWAFRNEVRAQGYRNLGLPCQLMGTGMAFPWGLVDGAMLATSHVVEDLKLGLALAARGRAPVFCPSTRVDSEFPGNEEGAQSQRQRWEHGHLSVLLSEGLPTLWRGLRQRNQALVALAMDMSVPPLALLVMLSLGYAVACGVAAWLSPAYVPLAALSLLVLALLATAVLLGWWMVGRRWVRAVELLFVPVYVLKKVPLYLAFVFKRQTVWVKTKRGP